MITFRNPIALAVVALTLLACTPGPSASAPPETANAPGEAVESNRTLVAVVRTEPESLLVRPVIQSGSFAGLALMRRLANAELTLLDDRLVRRPYLAETLPQIDSDTWRVFPDGQMETTWRLKPGIRWHDGVPLTAQDFVFAWSVYSRPEFGSAGSRSMRAIADVAALDERTIVVRYQQPYPSADDLSGQDGLPPLPRHLLEQPVRESDPAALAVSPFWTRDYVGLGPYRVERWEPGSYVEGVAFDQHTLGRPRIGRVRIMFVGDANTALANLLAGTADFLGDSAIGFEQAMTLKSDWEKRGSGAILLRNSQWRATAFQLRPELATPPALLDVRVRKALAHAVDKPALRDNIYQGEMVVSDFLISPYSRWGPIAERGIVKYPYDLRRSEQLMTEAGFIRGTDGVFVGPGEARFRAELKTAISPDWVAEMAAMANEWRRAGFDVQDAVLPAALSIDPEARVAFPGMFTSITSQGEATLEAFTTAQIPRVENRWRGGNNRGGWSNPEYDGLVTAFAATLEPNERAAQLTQMARIFTEELPMISLLFLAQPYARVAALQGVLPVAPEGDITWNIHEWTFQ